MKQLILFLTMLFSTTSFAGNHVIVWGTDVWENFTETDGSGFYHHLMSDVFTEPNYQIDVKYLPWKRNLQYLKNGQIHMTGAIPASDEFELSARPILSETIYAVFPSRYESSCCEFKDLVGGYRRGYDIDIFYKALPTDARGIEVDSAKMGMMLLNNGKIGFYVDIGSVLDKVKPANRSSTLIQKAIGTYHLYWAFHKSDKGRVLKRYFDANIEKLHQQGKLVQLYQKYNLTMP